MKVAAKPQRRSRRPIHVCHSSAVAYRHNDGWWTLVVVNDSTGGLWRMWTSPDGKEQWEEIKRPRRG